MANSAENACPTEFIEVGLASDTSGVYHAPNNLVDTFHDAIGLWITGGNQLLPDSTIVVP